MLVTYTNKLYGNNWMNKISQSIIVNNARELFWMQTTRYNIVLLRIEPDDLLTTIKIAVEKYNVHLLNILNNISSSLSENSCISILSSGKISRFLSPLFLVHICSWILNVVINNVFKIFVNNCSRCFDSHGNCSWKANVIFPILRYFIE